MCSGHCGNNVPRNTSFDKLSLNEMAKEIANSHGRVLMHPEFEERYEKLKAEAGVKPRKDFGEALMDGEFTRRFEELKAKTEQALERAREEAAKRYFVIGTFCSNDQDESGLELKVASGLRLELAEGILGAAVQSGKWVLLSIRPEPVEEVKS